MVPSRPTIITPAATASSVSGGLPRQRRTLPPGLAGRVRLGLAGRVQLVLAGRVRLGRAAGALVLVMRSPTGRIDYLT
jgi:hypothetical protein